jgi:VWFA-related protein
MRSVVLALALLAAARQNVGAQEQTYRFERRVDVVTVDIAVTDDGRPLGGLTAADFEIRDNGVLQEIDSVQVETAPVDAILILDTSMSVAGPKLGELRAAVANFMAGLRDEDRVALVTFSAYVQLWQTLTTDRSAIRDALAGVDARGLTALKDGLYGGLSLAGPSAQRPIAVLFSDGLDNASWTSESQLEEVVKESNAVVYVVGNTEPRSEERTRRGTGYFGRSVEEPKDRQRVRHGRFSVHARLFDDRFLQGVADDSGGRYFEFDDASSMEQEFRRVVEDIRSRYLLSYYPTGVAEDGWHDLEVKLVNRKAELRARQGYYVEPTTQ